MSAEDFTVPDPYTPDWPVHQCVGGPADGHEFRFPRWPRRAKVNTSVGAAYYFRTGETEFTFDQMAQERKKA